MPYSDQLGEQVGADEAGSTDDRYPQGRSAVSLADQARLVLRRRAVDLPATADLSPVEG